MTPLSLPDEVRRSVESYLQLTDEAVPGLVQGLYCTGRSRTATSVPDAATSTSWRC
ncbi:hypothetical protein [Streptomyces sp. NPDC017958]|uniref:hypothetical protein n=1 Tax=Streptomyces sp. NPDC017958 TaxID=3365021 RepID=UPI0037B46CD7